MNFDGSGGNAQHSWREGSDYQTVAPHSTSEELRLRTSTDHHQREYHVARQPQGSGFPLPQPRPSPGYRHHFEQLNRFNQPYGLVSESMWLPPQTRHVNTSTFPNATNRTFSAASTTDDGNTTTGRRSISKQLDWEKHKLEIKKMYLDDDKTLDKTIQHMADQFGFVASAKLYKEKFKEWNWQKNLSGKKARWVVNHARERKREGKDTIYKLGEQILSMEQIQGSADRSAKRSKLHLDDAAGVGTTPAGISYDTPSASAPSPFYTSPEAPATPPGVDNEIEDVRYPRFTWNGHTKSYFDDLLMGVEQLELEGKNSEAQAKYRDALCGYRKLLSHTHHQITSVAYRLANLYAKTHDMREADGILEWMTKVHIRDLGLWNPRTVQHLTRVVEMLQSWCRKNEAIPLLDHLFQGQGSPSQTISVPMAVPDFVDTEGIESQLALTDILASVDNSIETRLIPLVERCEDRPTDFPAQTIRAWTALIRAYVDMKHEAKKEDTLTRAVISTRIIMKMENSAWSMHLFQSLLALIQMFVQAGNCEFATEVLLDVEEKVEDIFGDDHEKTIRILADIGMLYQKEDRWEDAEPYFEHAQAVAARAYGRKDAHTKRFEDARRNGYYQPMPTSRLYF